MNLTDAEMERYLERAAIMEYDALLPRRDAERLAMEGVIAERTARMTGREQARELARKLKVQGFTLLELLLVMLALFCLGTVAIVAYARAMSCTL